MKIYTRTGDNGSTGLIGGQRVSKADLRLDVYGTVDELNASLGVAMAALTGDDCIEMKGWLTQVQHDLFVVGSHLATPAGSGYEDALPVFEQRMVDRLEQQIDSAEQRLPALKQFILPGGSEPASRLHLARCICRRAERLLSAFVEQESVRDILPIYLNRLSDWLFVQARLANHLLGVDDVPWLKELAE